MDVLAGYVSSSEEEEIGLEIKPQKVWRKIYLSIPFYFIVSWLFWWKVIVKSQRNTLVGLVFKTVTVTCVIWRKHAADAKGQEFLKCVSDESNKVISLLIFAVVDKGFVS